MGRFMKKTKLPPLEIMHQAVEERDVSFEGIFFIAVKTTGIFCRPGCRAKLPKRQNIEFFASTREALEHGYRACKLCRPLEIAGAIPDWLQPILEEINENPEISLKDRDLRVRNIDPARIRRWFKKHHGMTFQAYLRARRVNRAFGRLREGRNVTRAAFESGYESLSGFSSAFHEITGFCPSESSGRKIISLTRILTPLGPMLAGAVDEGICFLEFTDRRTLDTQVKMLCKRLQAEFVPGNHRHFSVLDRQLQEYFAGERKNFTVALYAPGTPFQQKVWKILQDIPYGQTRSYQVQAIALDNPGAVRAVARANGENRIGIVIPCHRVIGKDGNLVGYAGGLWRKRYLLNLEQGGHS
jgi:AraC family transcriptional regulator of adaptative response/methylated-DNA-[protein]-cysteine methyltransferase